MLKLAREIGVHSTGARSAAASTLEVFEAAEAELFRKPSPHQAKQKNDVISESRAKQMAGNTNDFFVLYRRGSSKRQCRLEEPQRFKIQGQQ